MRALLFFAVALTFAVAGCAQPVHRTGSLVVPPGETASFVMQNAKDGGNVRWTTQVHGNATCAFYADGSLARDLPCASGNLAWVPALLEVRWTNAGPGVALVEFEAWVDEGEVFA